jgi:hypothetical protein
MRGMDPGSSPGMTRRVVPAFFRSLKFPSSLPVQGTSCRPSVLVEGMRLNLAAATAATGDKVASSGRNIVEKRMTPAQIAEAQRLAREWKPEK